jgi:predicted flavoprotein YhiN
MNPKLLSLLAYPSQTLEDGKVFPLSLQASSVLDIFRLALEERGIPLYLNSKVKEIMAVEKASRSLHPP